MNRTPRSLLFCPRTALALLLTLSACQHAAPSNVCHDGDCAIDAASSAVTQMALSTATQTTQLTITNPTAYEFSPGLITLRPVFTLNAAASAALADYVATNGSAEKPARTLAQSLGFTLGVDAWAVGKIAAGASVAITLNIAPGTPVYYLARVKNGVANDFVAASVTLGSGQTALSGYSITAQGVTLGNSTTGASPAGASFGTTNLNVCASGGSMSVSTTLLSEDFKNGANDALWPANIGYAGDFNGDWYTDGVTARVRNPRWPGGDPNAPASGITGFVKFIDVCPLSGATLSITADVDTTGLTDAESNTTLVVYYFDASNQVLRADANLALTKGNGRRIAIYDASLPTGTRRVAIVPMVYISLAEQGTVFYSSLTAQYEPPSKYTATTLVDEKFSSYGASSYGANQPTGWAEFGGDWFAYPGLDFATLWNSAWGGDPSHLPPVDTGLVKQFNLGALQAGDTISAQVFAAVTFTDPTSFVRLRLVFDTPSGPFVESDRFTASNYNTVEIRRAAIPTGAKTVYVIINAYLGKNEKSSLYVDNLRVEKVHAN